MPLKKFQVSRGLPKEKALRKNDTPNPKAAGDVGTHPPYGVMIFEAISAIGAKKGSSKLAIFKYILSNYNVESNINTNVKAALKRMVAAGSLKQVKGHGASGSFRIGIAKKGKASAVGKKTVTTPKKAIKAPKNVTASASVPADSASTSIKKIVAAKKAMKAKKPTSPANKSAQNKVFKKASSPKSAVIEGSLQS